MVGTVLFVLLCTLAIRTTRPVVEEDLNERTQAALISANLRGVQVQTAGRDLTLTGKALNEESVQRAVTVTAELEGVRSVETTVEIAPPPAMPRHPAQRQAPALPTPPATASQTTPRPTVAKASQKTPATASPLSKCEVALDKQLTQSAVHFVGASALLTRKSIAVMEKLGASVRACQGRRIVISAHINPMGDPQFDLYLSQMRADVVALTLVRSGVISRRLRAIGYGSSRPSSSDPRADNQRVEFQLVPPGA